MLILKHPRARRLVVLLSVALLAGCSERIGAERGGSDAEAPP
jgi:hypothetical protein